MVPFVAPPNTVRAKPLESLGKKQLMALGQHLLQPELLHHERPVVLLCLANPTTLAAATPAGCGEGAVQRGQDLRTSLGAGRAADEARFRGRIRHGRSERLGLLRGVPPVRNVSAREGPLEVQSCLLLLSAKLFLLRFIKYLSHLGDTFSPVEFLVAAGYHAEFEQELIELGVADVVEAPGTKHLLVLFHDLAQDERTGLAGSATSCGAGQDFFGDVYVRASHRSRPLRCCGRWVHHIKFKLRFTLQYLN